MDGQSLALIITTIGGFATLVFKSMHDMSVKKQQREEDRLDRLAAAERAKAEREDEARHVRERLEASTQRHAQFTQEALNAQTDTMLKAIAEARAHMASRAEVAFTEANDVNSKIEKLHQMQLHQGIILTQLLTLGGPKP